MATTARASNTPHRQFTRATPAIFLVAIALLLALHHWWVMTHGTMYMVPMILLFMFGGMAAGGTLYPPLFYAVGKYGTHLPLPIRLLGGAFAIAGVALGFYVMVAIYQVKT